MSLNRKEFRVLVVGFESYLSGVEESSWSIVSNLDENEFDAQINIEKIKIENSYQNANDQIDYIWTNLDPHLVIIVGLMIGYDYMTIEKCSFNRAYRNKDKHHKLPNDNSCIDSFHGRLETSLNLENLPNEITKSIKRKYDTKFNCVISSYPGENIDAYFYYLSLFNSNSKSILIQIPCKTNYTEKEILYSIKVIILECLKRMYN